MKVKVKKRELLCSCRACKAIIRKLSTTKYEVAAHERADAGHYTHFKTLYVKNMRNAVKLAHEWIDNCMCNTKK